MTRTSYLIPITIFSTFVVGMFLFQGHMASATTCQGYVYLTNENEFSYSNGNNTSITEGSENCYQVQNNMHNIIAANHMNQIAEQNMQKFIEQQRKSTQTLEHEYFQPINLNASMTIQIAKQKLAAEYWNQAYQQRSQYMQQVHDAQNQILNMMKILHQQRFNIDSIPKNMTSTQ